MPARLLFLINGDASGARKEMEGLADTGKKTGADFGEKFGKNALAQIRAYIGIAAIARLIAGTMKGAVSEGARITAGAAKLGVRPETFQMLEQMSEASGESMESIRDNFEELTKNPRGLVEWEQAMANARIEGKLLSDEQVANMKAWEMGLTDLTRGVRRAIGETLTQKPGEFFTRKNLPELSTALAPQPLIANELLIRIIEELKYLNKKTADTNAMLEDL